MLALGVSSYSDGCQSFAWPNEARVASGTPPSAAVDLLNSPREKTVIVTELALADGNWRDLVERMRGIDICVPIVLATSSRTAELWWDALECGIDDILPGHLAVSRLCQLLETQGAS
jgi:DNA-binding NtrC family response regulator